MTTIPDTISLIGNTPLVRLKGPSEESGCEIYGKCEFANPGASVKDRAALYIVRDAEEKGQLKPGGIIVEGTAGNTGIGLALVANARGYKTIIVMPETQSKEKMDTLRALGAELVLVPAAPYSNPGHFVHTSRRIAEETPGAIWANQFDNVAKTFRRARVLDGISLAIGLGERVALIGSNGAGKTTLIRCLLGEYTYDGAVTVNGLDPRGNRTTVLGSIGFVPQLPPPLKMPAVLVSSPTANRPAACALMGPVLPLPVKAPPTPERLACSVSFSAVTAAVLLMVMFCALTVSPTRTTPKLMDVPLAEPTRSAPAASTARTAGPRTR